MTKSGVVCSVVNAVTLAGLLLSGCGQREFRGDVEFQLLTT